MIYNLILPYPSMKPPALIRISLAIWTSNLGLTKFFLSSSKSCLNFSILAISEYPDFKLKFSILNSSFSRALVHSLLLINETILSSVPYNRLFRCCIIFVVIPQKKPPIYSRVQSNSLLMLRLVIGNHSLLESNSIDLFQKVLIVACVLFAMFFPEIPTGGIIPIVFSCIRNIFLCSIITNISCQNINTSNLYARNSHIGV